MKGMLADNNIRRHFGLLLALFNANSRRELWQHLQLHHPSFQDLGLAETESDRALWLSCQSHELVLLTANRNDEHEDSLENTIRTLNSPDYLPVLTFADADRFLRDKSYAATTADRILELLFDMEKYLGTGRLYVP